MAFPVKCGPVVIVRFISRDNDNDVAVRVYGLISNIPKEKRSRILEACNLLNAKVRYTKFCLDTDGDINVEYDLPIRISDESVGEIVLETLIRFVQILNSKYSVFMMALYTNEELQVPEDNESAVIVQKIQELREHLEAQKKTAGDPNEGHTTPNTSDDLPY